VHILIRHLTSFLISLTLLISSACYATQTVRLTSGEWPPYLSNHLAEGGFATKIVTEAFNEMGIEVEISYYPWKRSYNYAMEGKDPSGNIWNGTIVWIKTEQRMKSFYYSDPVITDEDVLFYLAKSSLHWKTVADLEGKIIGGTAHTAYPTFEQAHKDGLITLQRGGNYDSLLKRIFHQKIDAAQMPKQVGLYYLNHSFSTAEQKQFTYSPTVIERRTYHLILSKNRDENKALLKLFNQGLAKLHSNGRYRSLVSQLRRGSY